MIDYGRAVVSLGLEKAKLQLDIDAMRKDLNVLEVSRSLIIDFVKMERDKLTDEKKKEFDEKIAMFSDFKSKTAQEKDKCDAIALQSKQLEEKIKSMENDLILLQESLGKTAGDKLSLQEKIFILKNKKSNSEREIEFLTKNLADLKKNSAKLSDDVNEKIANKFTLEQELSTKYLELNDLNDIINVLKLSNKDGLDLTASFEGERNRLLKKEKALLAKEADLAIYEKRLRKRISDAGVDVKITL